MTAQLLRSFRTDFRLLVSHQPARPAIVDSGRDETMTWGDLAERMDGVLATLASRGVKPGGTVMALLPHSVEALVCFLATQYGGLGFAPLTPEATAREARQWTAIVRPDLCLAEAGLSVEMRAVLAEAGVPILELAPDGRFAWLEGATRAPVPARDGSGRLYLTTSGSTGDPRALVFDGDRLWSSARAFVAHHGFIDEGACFLNMLPMSYLGGLFNLCLIPLACGGSVVVWEAFTGRSFLNFWQTVERFEVTVLWLVPSIVRGLLTLAQRIHRPEIAGRATSVKASFLGTAPIDLATKAKFEEMFGIPLLENFALSETTFFTTETLNTRSRRCEGSVGEVLPYAEIRLVAVDEGDEQGRVPTEIRVRSPFLFLGYLQPDGSLGLPLDEDGFLPTGDLGHMAGDQLVIDGRARDIIKKGGYFVPLREIEILAQSFEGVAEACAVRALHDFYGETYVLHLRPDPGQGEADLLARFGPWLHANLVRYKWPERIVLAADFPRTASGKIRKHLIGETPR